MALKALPIYAMQQPSTKRVARRPRHNFQVRVRPWQIQPFMLAPVLPGETMKQLLLQARVVTDPIKNPLIGWWWETYFFYVTHRQMVHGTVFMDMMLNLNQDVSSAYAVTDVSHHHYSADTTTGDAIDYVAECLQPVTEEYFRAEGEAWDDYLIDTLPLVNIGGNPRWLDSARDATTMEVGDTLSGSGGESVMDLDQSRLAWEFMRDNQMMEMSYEDFLKTYGVRPAVAADAVGKPELVRYLKEWTYPSNTIDPTTGAPSSACSWAISDRADKDRYFKEPGFLFGVCCARPKVYLSKQRGNAASMLKSAFGWLPAIMQDDPSTSMFKQDKDWGPLAGQTNDYWVDLRDLFIYGDEFKNFALTETDAGLVALPTAALQKRYASATDADALFDSASPANKIRADGVVSLNILGRQTDQT